MRSSEPFITTAFQRKPWLQWIVVVSVPMMYFFVVRLVTMPNLLDVLATWDEDRTTVYIFPGVMLGMLEDFVIATLLLIALLVTEVTTLLCTRMMIWAGADEHFHTSMILRGIGRTVRFFVILTLVAITLAPFSLDMMMIRSQKTRQAVKGASLPAHRDGSHAQDSSAGEGNTVALVSVALVSIAFTLLFIWRMNLVHWWPMEEEVRPSETVSSLSFSTPTYMDIRFEPLKLTPLDTELGKAVDEARVSTSRHTTIVSAPCELYGDDETSQSRSRRTTLFGVQMEPWMRISVIVCLALGVFLLLVDVTYAASHRVNPLVAGIALNASLNDFMYGLFRVQFLPSST